MTVAREPVPPTPLKAIVYRPGVVTVAFATANSRHSVRLNAVLGHSATSVLPSWSLSPLASQSLRATALKRRLYVPATSRTVWVTEPVLWI